jgi:hypothetical protein
LHLQLTQIIGDSSEFENLERFWRPILGGLPVCPLLLQAGGNVKPSLTNNSTGTGLKFEAKTSC